MTVEQILSRKIFGDLDITKVTKYQKNEINKILEVYNGKAVKNRLKNIHDFIKYNVDGDWLERIDIIVNTLKNDVASEYALEIRYGKENVELVKSELYPKFTHTLDKYVNKYGDTKGNKKWAEYLIKSKTPWGLEACVKRYGEVDGAIKWEERLKKKCDTMNERKKLKPYRNGRTLPEYQNRYGVKDGYNRWLKRNNKQKYRFSEKYFTDLCGDDEGLIKWGEYCQTMSKTSLKAFIERYGDEVGTDKYEEFLYKSVENLKLRPNFSKISQELFYSVKNGFKCGSGRMYFANENGEYILYPSRFDEIFGIIKIIQVDFKYGNKIIEFDGDYWHSKPEQIKKDKLRDEYLIGKGYKILRVKESEYKMGKDKTINECIKFLNNKS
mgnify:CR=1 FL=1|tara:strand:+ start:16143 stop:17291 length:1149 start_codon:yes stop_codon:yes gene_type:complete